jgi:hypothetical protein
MLQRDGFLLTRRSPSWGSCVTRGPCRGPAAIEGHVYDLAVDLRYAAAILVVEEKDAPRALSVLTLIALAPVACLLALMTSVL